MGTMPEVTQGGGGVLLKKNDKKSNVTIRTQISTCVFT